MNKFLLGMSAPFQGARMILAHRELKRQAFLPILLTVIVLFAGIFFGFYFAPDIFSWVFKGMDLDNHGFVMTVLTVLGYISIVLFIFLFSYFFAAVVSVPFNSVLAEKTLRIIGISKPGVQGFFKMLKVSLVKSVVFGLLVLFMFIFSFIPGLSLIVLYAGLMLLAFDCMDYSLEVLEMNFKERMGFLRSHVAEISGFAVVLGLIFLVPFVNFLLLPVAVTGGAYLVGNIKNVKK